MQYIIIIIIIIRGGAGGRKDAESEKARSLLEWEGGGVEEGWESE